MYKQLNRKCNNINSCYVLASLQLLSCSRLSCSYSLAVMAVLAQLVPVLLVGVVSCFLLQGLPAVQGYDLEQSVIEQVQDEEQIMAEQDEEQFMTEHEEGMEEFMTEQAQDEEQFKTELDEAGQEQGMEQFMTEEGQDDAGMFTGTKRKVHIVKHSYTL